MRVSKHFDGVMRCRSVTEEYSFENHHAKIRVKELTAGTGCLCFYLKCTRERKCFRRCIEDVVSDSHVTSFSIFPTSASRLLLK